MCEFLVQAYLFRTKIVLIRQSIYWLDWIYWCLTPLSICEVISWRSVLLVGKTGVPGGNRRPSVSTSSHENAAVEGMFYLARCSNHICHRGVDWKKAASFRSGQVAPPLEPRTSHFRGNWHTTEPRLPVPQTTRTKISYPFIESWNQANQS